MDARILRITPILAETWLKTSENVRRTSPRAVAKLAADMAAGNWSMTGEPIILTEDGILLDGFHRLAAVVKAGVEVDCMVVRGVERSAVHHMDQGRSRTKANMLTALGYSRSADIAAVVTVLGNWATSDTNPSGDRALRTSGFYEGMAHQLAVVYADSWEWAVSRALDNRIARESMRGCSRSSVVALLVVAYEMERAVALQFGPRLCDQDPAPTRRDPEFWALRTLDRIRLANSKGSAYVKPRVVLNILGQAYMTRRSARTRAKCYTIGDTYPTWGRDFVKTIVEAANG